jgi:hypothetical protein
MLAVAADGCEVILVVPPPEWIGAIYPTAGVVVTLIPGRGDLDCGGHVRE